MIVSRSRCSKWHRISPDSHRAGDQLRRALSNKQGEAAVLPFGERFLQGAQEARVPEPIAEKVFEQLVSFGRYSFPKSHAAAFADNSYQSACCADITRRFAGLLRHQPMGFTRRMWSSLRRDAVASRSAE